MKKRTGGQSPAGPLRLDNPGAPAYSEKFREEYKAMNEKSSERLKWVETTLAAAEEAPTSAYLLGRLPALIEQHFPLRKTILYYRDEGGSRFAPYSASNQRSPLPVLEENNRLIGFFAKRSESLYLEKKHSPSRGYILSSLRETFPQTTVNLIIPLRHRQRLCGLLLTDLPKTEEKYLDEILGRLNLAIRIVAPTVEAAALRLENDRNYHRLFRFDHLVQIGQMTAEIIHELRTPLSTILLECGDWFDQVLPGTEADNSVRAIRQEVARVNRFADSLLRFAKFNEISPATLRLGEFIHDAMATIPRKRFPAKAAVTVDIRQELTVETDASRLLQVFFNILNNAFDAVGNKAGGAIAVTLRPDEAGKHAVITVADNGSGISAAVLSRLFQPFNSTKAAGTGLGLFNSYNVMQALRGDLRISSNEKGTIASIIIPGARHE